MGSRFGGPFFVAVVFRVSVVGPAASFGYPFFGGTFFLELVPVFVQGVR